MTRINTNVSSLNAQKSLARSNTALQQALTRLSTGLRINVGKDDPAGLIASEVLRSDIISTQRAIVNSERANQMIATADSALGQVSGLLNDIRGLVSEAANTGAMATEQIAANQLQIDSSLEAIDRIAQVTQFQGKRLLDGSLDFVTEGVDRTKIVDLSIEQANFGAQDEISVGIDVVKQATRAQLNYHFGTIPEDVVLEIGGPSGFEAFSFAAGSTIENMAAAINLVSDALGIEAQVQTEATAGSIIASSYGADNDVVITANQAGEDEGDVRVKYTAQSAGASLAVNYTASSGSDPGILEVQLAAQAWVAASGTVDEAGVDNNAFFITADVKGAEFNGVGINVVDTGGPITLSYDHSTKTLAVGINDGVTTALALINAVNDAANFPDVAALFTAVLSPDNDGSGLLTVAGMNTAGLNTAGGIDGGAVTSTANDVIAAINASAAAGDLTASPAGGNDGHETVTPFQEYAYYGLAEANDRLQFFGPKDSQNIRFVSSPGQSLGVDTSTDPRVERFSSAVIQGVNANSTFEIVAKTKGAEYDDVDVKFIDNAGANPDYVVYDPENQLLTINVDVTGGTTANDVITLINVDSYVSRFFRGQAFGTSTGTGNVHADMVNGGNPWVTTSGGLVSAGTLIVNLATDDGGLVTTTAQDLIDYFDDPLGAATLQPLGISVSSAEGSDGSGRLMATTSDLAFATSGTDVQDTNASMTTTAVNGRHALIEITAIQAGTAYEGASIEFEDSALAGGGDETVVWDPLTKMLTVGIKVGVTDADDVIALFDPVTGDAVVRELFSAARGADPSGTTGLGTGLIALADTGTTTGGATDVGTEDGAALLGNSDEANTGLAFRAKEYGSDAFASIVAIEGSFLVTDVGGNSTERSVGTDVDVRVNGVQAVAKGLFATINTSALDLNFSVDETAGDGDSTSYTITGGGARFQMGPEVVSNQQARLGITSVNTAKLGGVAGRLYELRLGNAKALDGDIIGAAKVVEEVISQVTTLRGRLGAFQRTTLETNINALTDTLEALTAAESSIRDADFAVESASLTRAQILVQSGIAVLTIANQNPQNVLALLR